MTKLDLDLASVRDNFLNAHGLKSAVETALVFKFPNEHGLNYWTVGFMMVSVQQRRRVIANRERYNGFFDVDIAEPKSELQEFEVVDKHQEQRDLSKSTRRFLALIRKPNHKLDLKQLNLSLHQDDSAQCISSGDL